MVRTVLIVDDDEPFAEFLRQAVEAAGHRAVVATDGARAFTAFEEHRPDLVFLDLLLPKRDGFRVCQDLRADERGKGVPVVLMTGIYKKVAYEREGLEKLGASAYVYKPFGVRETWHLLRRLLGERTQASDLPSPTPPGGADSLAETPLPVVLARHVALGSTGVVFVRGAGVGYVVHLQEGAVTFLRSNDAEDSLGRVLVRTGKVTPAQVQKALDAQGDVRGRTRLGQALVAQGALTKAQVETSLQLQFQLIARRAAALARGHCAFVPGDYVSEEEVVVQDPTPALLFRMALHAGSTDAVRRSLPAGPMRLVRAESAADPVPALAIGADEEHLLRLAEDCITVERFLAIARAAGLDGPRLILAMRVARLVRTEAGEAPSEAACGDFDPESLGSHPFGAVLVSAVMARATGVLEVTAPDCPGPRTIAMREGRIVHAASPREADRLAALLPRLEIVDGEALARTLLPLGAAPTDEATAVAVRSAGLLSPTELYWAATYQAHVIVNALLEQRGPTLTWTPGALPDDLAFLPDVPMAEVVIDAVAACDAEAVRALAPGDGCMVRAAEAARSGAVDAPLSSAQRAALEGLARPVRVGDWLAEAGSEQERASRLACLVAFAAAGLVDVTEPARRDLPPVAPEMAQAPRLLEEEAWTGSPADDAADIVIDVDGAADVPAAAACADPAAPAETAADGSARDVARGLRDLAPLLRVLRGAFNGTERRVQVDRARMAELLDHLVALANDARAAATDDAAEPALAAAGIPGSRPT